MTVAGGRIDYADVSTSITGHGNILPNNGVGVVTGAAPVVVVNAAIVNPWPPEPEIVILTDIAHSDAELTELAAARSALVEIAKTDVRIT